VNLADFRHQRVVLRITWRWLGAIAASLFLASVPAAEMSNTARHDFWVVDGFVFTTVVTNGVVYVGGDFRSVAPNAGRGALLNIFSGESSPLLPQVNGAILSVVPDGAGGWFVGGEFTAIGGFPRTNLAHILADLKVDPAWAPNAFGFTSVTQRSRIFALARSDTALYVGGIFTNISAQSRNNLAALDLTTGAALPWNGSVTGEIYALTLQENRLFVGGAFNAVGGLARNHLAAVEATTGNILPWAPVVSFIGGGGVTCFALNGNTLYVGGDYDHINGLLRNNIAAFDLNTGDLSDWDPNANAPLHALQFSCNTLYLAGSFTAIGGTPRNRLGAVDGQTATPTLWNPDCNESVFSLAIVGNTIFAGGWFDNVGGFPRTSLVAIDRETGQITPWTANADRVVLALAAAGNYLFAGGGASAGGLARRNAAAFDEATGQPLPWNPAPDGPVYALAVGTNAVYLGGVFSTIGGQPRANLAAVNRTNGQALNWTADVTSTRVAGTPAVYALALRTNALYAAGFFTEVNGFFRAGAAAMNLSDGTLTSWAPTFDFIPHRALTAVGSNIFIGGYFTTVNGVRRDHIAEINALTGATTAWSNSVNDLVFALAAETNTVYAGGLFYMAGGQLRVGAAAFDRTTAAVKAWNPQLNPSATANSWTLGAIAIGADAVFIGGAFDTIQGVARQGLAAVDRVTGAPTAFNASLGDYRATTFALAASGSKLYCGGAFVTVGDEVRPFLAAFVETGFPRVVTQPAPSVVSPGQPATFQVVANGQQPLRYQWQFRGTNITGATNPTFTIASAQLSNSGPYRVVVTNTVGRSTSIDAALTVLLPVTVTGQPTNQTVMPGATVTLRVTASGNPPPSFQWRLNGVNIPGAVYSTLTISNAQPQDGGTYTVVVENGKGAITSQPAEVIVLSQPLPFTDNFGNDRLTLTASSGVGRGSNTLATAETGEPRHAGKPGGKSVWFTWRSPADGIAVFSTRGSAFDTLLAVYKSGALSETNALAADEDRGEFLTSRVVFNAQAGANYQIAIDGFAGASGNFVLSWQLELTTSQVPRVVNEPQSRSVPRGSSHVFDVRALGVAPLEYQWFHNCVPIPGATNDSLALPNIQPADVGLYFVRVTGARETADSDAAFLEIGPEPDKLSQDKLQDLMFLVSSGGAAPLARQAALLASSSGAIVVNLGIIDAQLLDNTGARSQPGEPNHCGVLGGASKWLALQPSANASMIVDTIGSLIDTVLSVYTGNDPASLVEVACDNNGAPDGIRSTVRFSARATTNYWVVVDGVNGVQGPITLNWKMGTAPVIVPGPPPRSPRQGQPYALTVVVTNAAPPPTFQWFFNGQLIVGATNSTLILENPQLANSGVYQVIASNFAGAVTNSFGLIEVAVPIRVTPTLVSSNGTFHLRIAGAPAKKYIVERANGPAQLWLPLYTNSSSTAAPIQFTDPQPSTNRVRLYRVVPWP